MIVFPNCKINLGLHILRKRSDGYHELETIFYPIAINDILEITEHTDPVRSSTMPFTLSGQKIEGSAGNNLCVKAYKLLKKDFRDLPHIQMHLFKTIPPGAGLGGGSADAAFTLLLLNDKFRLGLTNQQLIDYAIQLGSDCPFFIINKPCFATGRGEILEPIDLDLSSYKLVIINPGIHISTGEAFRHIRPAIPEKSLKDILLLPIERWKDELKNDFEGFCFRKYPEIVNIKDQLYISGALYASMSGSGSTVYGIFPKDATLQFSFPATYFIRELVG